MTALSDIYVPLHRIIPFSNVEGQGNRTSIFLQGCKLNCLYCHNPETIPRYAEGAPAGPFSQPERMVPSASNACRALT